MNKAKVTICSKEYTVVSDEPTEYIIRLSNALDEKLKSALQNSTDLDLLGASLLIAMDLLDSAVKDLQKLEQQKKETENAKEQADAYKEVVVTINRELDRVKWENKELLAQMQTLQEQAEKYPSDALSTEEQSV